MEFTTKVIGWPINSMERVGNIGQVANSLKVPIIRAVKMVKEFSDGPTEISMKGNSKITKWTDSAFLCGRINNTKDNGKRVKCMGKVNFNGQMEEDMSDIINSIKRMVMGNSFGQMENIIKGNGKMENNMVMVSIEALIWNKKEKHIGMMGRELNG